MPAELSDLVLWNRYTQSTHVILNYTAARHRTSADTDLGLWCGPTHVNLMRGEEKLGAFPYEKVLPEVERELKKLSQQKK